MSDDFASIDAALDGAFASVDGAQAAIAEEIDRGILPPNALSTEGIWALAKEEKEREKAAKAEKAKTEKAERAKEGKGDKPDKAERDGRRSLGNRQLNKAEQQDGLDSAIEKALRKGPEAVQKRQDDKAAVAKGEKVRPLDTKEFTKEPVVKARKELASRATGMKLSERLALFEKWGDALTKDPVGASEAIRDMYLKVSTSLGNQKVETKASKHLGDVLDKAFDHGKELEDIKDFADRYGDQLPRLLVEINDLERDLIADPVGAAARLAAKHGALDAPKAPQQQQQDRLPPPANPEEDTQRVVQGIERAIEHNILPGLKNDQIAWAVADVLTRMPRTADRFADLQAAYAIVVQHAAPAAVAPAKDAKGSKSIKGAPSVSTSRPRSKGDSKGLDAALDRAFGGI
ncbi:hypothetical protein WI604_15890 [Bradyrhizobium symbiodeficiens]|uniref:hypothetical protein n=1 Tax=Bradyrhizobium symbiodeficiens TaxID=1404367 RepID=UPI0030D08C3C